MILVGDMRLLPYFLCGDLLPGLSGAIIMPVLARASVWKIAGVSWSRNFIALDHARHRVTRLTGAQRDRPTHIVFLPTHCSHNGDRKRDLYAQCSLNGFSCKRCFWPGMRVTG